MDAQEFVQNIKKYCDVKGVKPTIACKESGAGKDLINQIERRGSMPSIERVMLLADYLGVTTSELLGELVPTAVSAQGDEITSGEYALVVAYRAASEDDRAVVDAALRKYRCQSHEEKVM